ncbi:unnamed protein product [Moritella viscosa]|uniref:Uncharacterized protein n=1 Tax=Moritella viscosa TaxID=80854 RepID=A0ABY1H9Q7_9GAMM|nr:unnamed protein product [Moritella viscosa]SGY93374.1 unnamed protein product [Moritella viscosa]SHO28121.1 unnamed protein product [Moritella viscosa]
MFVFFKLNNQRKAIVWLTHSANKKALSEVSFLCEALKN